MAKKQSGSLVQGLQIGKNVRPIEDERLDYSDIPASTDEELKRAKRVGRPSTGNAKRLIAIRIDPKVLTQLKKLAIEHDVPYQTFIHELLRKAAKKAA